MPPPYARAMRFHLPTLPGRPTTRENSTCAYSGYVRKFAQMMVDAGHEVIVYGDGPDTNGCAGEFVPTYVGQVEPLDFHAELWRKPNRHAVAQISERAEPGDWLGIIGGQAQALVADSLPELRAVEYRVGYGGTCTRHRIFETYAWLHMVYGSQAGDAHAADGVPTDAVIPPPFEAEDFAPATGNTEDYLLYVGRLIERKGIATAIQVAERTGRDLILAGEGDFRPEHPQARYIGKVGPAERRDLMAHAAALIYPTLYVEPGGGAAIEAQLCGTPVLTTDWGCFTETVVQGMTGYRCRTLAEFDWAADAVEDLDRDLIHRHAVGNYSMPVIRDQYEHYFRRIDNPEENPVPPITGLLAPA